MSVDRRVERLQKLCTELKKLESAADEQGQISNPESEMAPAQEVHRLDEEQEKMVNFVCEPRSSLLVVGRSGTGKTTVAIQRMVLGQMQHGNSLHQIFVTMNPVLLSFVKRNFRAFCPRSGATREHPTSLLSACDDDFPLFLDTRQWLTLLMRTVIDFLPGKSVCVVY